MSLTYENFFHYKGKLLARYAIILKLYSIFERFSVLLSEKISNKYNLIKIDDLNGKRNFSGIKKFYTIVYDIKFKEWNKLESLRQVRHLIAHCDGYINFSEQESRILKISDTDTNLIILKDGRIAMNKEFIRDSMRAIFNFFDIVEPAAQDVDTMFDFSWCHINEFIEFDGPTKIRN